MVVVEGVSNMSIERRKKNRLSPWIKWNKLNMNWIWNWNWNQNDKNVVDDIQNFESQNKKKIETKFFLKQFSIQSINLAKKNI